MDKAQAFYLPKLIAISIILCCFFARESNGQEQWKANWLGLSARELPDFAVVQARNEFELRSIPSSLIVDLSAVIRYKLYVNGIYIGQGPANNDLKHYTFDSHEIARYLRVGKNVIALTVFSLGEMDPLRYQSDGLKFILQTKDELLSTSLNTGKGNWKVMVNNAYGPTYRDQDFEVIGYFAMGGGEEIEGRLFPWDWAGIDFDDRNFIKPKVLHAGDPYGYTHSYGRADISLSPREIPYMDEEEEQRPSIRKVVGINPAAIQEAWQSEAPLKIPKNSEVTLLLDQSYLTKGHVAFGFTGGRDARVKVSYAETLFNPDKSQGNRNEIEGKEFIGLADRYLLDGGKNRVYEQLLPRTWRYIEVKINTASEELTWDFYKAHKFIYPFQEQGSFQSPFVLHDQIWEAGWRTALLCADETYMDCPYYEQLQYLGDTRIQALISLYVSGDDRLMRNAIKQFAHSISNEGITESRYPSSSEQYIPPYSLFFVNMLHDFYMHREDDEFVKSYLYDMAGILYWFENKLGDDGLLGPMPWWSYVDTAEGFEMASPPGFDKGGSIVLTLQYAYALQEALVLFEAFGKDHLVGHFGALYEKLKENSLEKGWDENRGLIADTEEKNHFSQHANVFAILSNTFGEELQKSVFERIISEEGISKSNIYFRFYLVRASLKAGKGDYFIQNLDTWENMLGQGLTTFAEHEENTRSDCHAWSASPNFEFIHTVAGIRPLEKHYRKVLVAPNPGKLTSLRAATPHPLGMISAEFSFGEQGGHAEISLPDGLSGVFRWQDREQELTGGQNLISW